MNNERARLIIERTADSVLRKSGLLAVFRGIDSRDTQVVRVLAYHRVNDFSDDPGRADPDTSVAPHLFAEQIGLLSRHYDPIGIADLQASLDGLRPLPKKAVLVTFDDAYRDFLTHAWPVLKCYGVPVVLFVPTAYPDSGRPFWWDDLWRIVVRSTPAAVSLPWAGTIDLRTLPARRSAARRLRRAMLCLHTRVIEQRIAELRGAIGNGPSIDSSILGWEELRLLAREGVVVASHGRSHSCLPALTDDEVVDEVEGGQADLERQIGSVWRAFAYPYGHVDIRAAQLLKRQGCIVAFGVSPGRNVIPRVNRFRMYRQCVGPGHSVSRMQLGLSGFYPVGLVRLRVMRWFRPG